MDTLYAIVKILLYPEVWILITLMVGLFLSWITRCPRSTRFTLCLLVILYYGFTTRPLAQVLVQPLETHHRVPATMPVDQDAIVLFVNDQLTQPASAERPTIVGTRNVDLFVCGLKYVQGGNAPRVVLADAAPDVFPPHATKTAALQEWAVFLGYPESRLLTVTEGVATHERARAIKRLLGSAGKILLIDEAIHLTRSAAAFQKVGFAVTPVPCDYQKIPTGSWSFSDFVPKGGNLIAVNEAIHEYAGLLTYWLRGLI